MDSINNAFALVVGIDNGYRYVRKLPPTQDAATIAAVLANPHEGGYSASNVRLLVNGEATREAILEGLDHLVAKADADSVVFIYFSGHGGRINSGPAAGEYLIPVDATADTDADLAASSISGQEFTALLDRLPARKVVIVFDACHAGGIGVLKDLTGSEIGNGLPGTYESLAAGHGRVIYASSEDDESSLVFRQDGYGLFTKHLVGGLRGGVPSDDGLIRVFDLFEYIQPRVTNEARPHPQHPVFKARIRENFPIALRLGGTPERVPRLEDGYQYDVYISYVDQEPGASWVWDVLVPRLENEGLRVAVAGDSDVPGVPRLVNAERGVTQARRTLAVLSDAYLDDRESGIQNLLAQADGVRRGTWPLIPVAFREFDRTRMPLRLEFLESIDLGMDGGRFPGGDRQPRAERAMQRLIRALHEPLPSST